jgi:hypothetical protein
MFLKCLLVTRLNHSYYHHLFCLDPVTTTVPLVPLHLIILSILLYTNFYASSLHDNLGSL